MAYSRAKQLHRIDAGFMELMELANGNRNRIADLLITFKTPVYHNTIAAVKWRSFQCNVLSKLFVGGLKVASRASTNNTIHLHIAVVCNDDINSGFSWELWDQYQRCRTAAAKRRCWKLLYATFNADLKHLYKQLRTNAKSYGFGHLKLLPIRKNIDALKNYYKSNVPFKRHSNDRCQKLISYWGFSMVDAEKKIQPATGAIARYRRNFALLMKDLGLNEANAKEVLVALLGTHWHWKLRFHLKAIRDNSNDPIEQHQRLILKTRINFHLAAVTPTS
ncbi:MAG: hypothetical protein EBU46_12215 [Nitrosomonadaceae bacterium]|nr:hypothetical protein [Nitrosomonadaceae bacterium]